MADQAREEQLYPGGIHYTLNDLADDDIKKVIARRVYAVVNDPVDEVEFNEDDPRVVFVETCGHGFFALGAPVKMDNRTYPIGTVIGEEDYGVDSRWVKALGWKSRYGLNVELSWDY